VIVYGMGQAPYGHIVEGSSFQDLNNIAKDTNEEIKILSLLS
jgi:hypothetical protein